MRPRTIQGPAGERTQRLAKLFELAELVQAVECRSERESRSDLGTVATGWAMVDAAMTPHIGSADAACRRLGRGRGLVRGALHEWYGLMEEGLAVGQSWKDDQRVILFVKLREGVTLDEDLQARIRRRIRANTTPRHVPAKIIAVADIPRTKSGKITELAVTDVIHGRDVKNREALANPEALDLYSDLAELQC